MTDDATNEPSRQLASSTGKLHRLRKEGKNGVDRTCTTHLNGSLTLAIRSPSCILMSPWSSFWASSLSLFFWKGEKVSSSCKSTHTDGSLFVRWFGRQKLEFSAERKQAIEYNTKKCVHTPSPVKYIYSCVYTMHGSLSLLTPVPTEVHRMENCIHSCGDSEGRTERTSPDSSL